MKHIALVVAVVGLTFTGCAQNRVFGPHARRGGADFKIARTQSKSKVNKPKTNIFAALNRSSEESFAVEESNEDIELAMFGSRGGCDDTCCDDTCCGDDCCGECCEGDCCDSCCVDGYCSDGCCSADGCSSGGCSSGGCFGGRRSSGCSSCGGRGCGLCQRMVGRIASGCCPHAGGYPEAYNFNPSPPTGQVAYPYYTVRGPRDFLRNNPPTIGPY